MFKQQVEVVSTIVELSTYHNKQVRTALMLQAFICSKVWDKNVSVCLQGTLR